MTTMTMAMAASTTSTPRTVAAVYTVSVGERCGVGQDLHRCAAPLVVCDIKRGQSLGMCKRARNTPTYSDEQAVEVAKEAAGLDKHDGATTTTTTVEEKVIDGDGHTWHTSDYGRTWTKE
ncbi:hypothetical protein SYNPS1DRAFT_26468 [Syncephalis pseudoplumigaleata]|uniref:Uncharacterized protein n=1 Tax=Syncephalis pseudoplumigaleata TaxID=1712513 RepID=A0A4P9Z837_9FUNG|nr:hypothetical protein SYNPS1DRAFT_26468 [Syncephalis pseudoplumigaleata]|eukprot:RKP27900.1 hypothetical protein SYNPS1DRAFT_26468 [Syncephalis pseudoplumigaleata]